MSPVFRLIYRPALILGMSISAMTALGAIAKAEPPPPTPVEPVHVTDAPPANIAEPDIGQAASSDDLAAVHHMAAKQIVAVLGDQVRFADGADVGRVADILVDRTGAPVGAVLDCGGYMGVGNRKVAVAWSSLHFAPSNDTTEIITSLTPDQVRSAPEYHEAADADLVSNGIGPAKLPVIDNPAGNATADDPAGGTKGSKPAVDKAAAVPAHASAAPPSKGQPAPPAAPSH